MKERTRISLAIRGAAVTGKPGMILRPGEALDMEVELSARPHPVRRELRVVGEVDVAWLRRCEPGFPARYYRSIADALDPSEASGERYSLKVSAAGEQWPRVAYAKAGPDSFRYAGLVGGAAPVLAVAVKGSEVRRDQGGELVVELGVYRRRAGRHPEDVFDAPDETYRLDLPEGTYAWTELSCPVPFAAEPACLLVRIVCRGFRGTVWVGSPRLAVPGGDTVIPPLEPESPSWPGLNWLGENLSRAEWPELELLVDGARCWSGAVFNAIYRAPDFAVPLPELAPGAHALVLRLLDSRPGALPFRVLSAEILEESARPTEIVWHPPYVTEATDFPVLVERNRGGDTELEVVHVASGEARPRPQYQLTVGGESQTVAPERVVRRGDDGITLSTGDAIYIAQETEAFRQFLCWYLEVEAGNAMCFRPTYRWSGTRELNPELWRWLCPLLERLGMRYHLMVDGRELPGKNANPPDELLRGPAYMGRQSHENDGAFCYWGTFREDALWADVYSRSKDRGGIFPVTRPAIREGSRVIQFFDPYEVKTMAEGAATLVRHLRETRAASTRHTGPSTLFRYFYQAGYEWLGAEQMYGPEEVILSALRGAARAYGRTDYGAHLAVQWSSIPHDRPAHARRYLLSLAACYLHGVSNINTEEGLWRMESEYAPHDRFSGACEIHRREHRRFGRFLATHPRRGRLRVPLAVLQGHLCGWRCFGRGGTWGSLRPEMAFGPPEESFDLLRVFYPRSRLDAIYRNPCPDDEPQGWYTGTPFGPVDIVPVEAPLEVTAGYRALVFLGWNTMREADARRLLAYVKRGGTLLLTRRHLSAAVERGAPVAVPESRALRELLGSAGRAVRAGGAPRRRKVGKGSVVYFPTDAYPCDAGVRKAYEAAMRDSAREAVAGERERGWVAGSADVEFAAYDREDGETRTIYALDIDWWSGAASRPARLLLGPRSFPIDVRAGAIEAITVRRGVAVMPRGEDADVIDVTPAERSVTITVQSDRGTELDVFFARPRTPSRRVAVAEGGVQCVLVEW
jgi:hypothetical protein